jgi:diaminohydroxyphosphoribosylaminopyrimidine deaminase / 5-amino-6-(5-phosphoribosylamino)uracil reductase
MQDKELYMQRCIDLARLGQGYVAPNPMVGCVIVVNEKVVGEGYHQCYGGPHAEVNAIEQVKDKSLLRDATLYVSLEPCAHFGKTPPCADLIIRSGIKKMVIGCVDSNEKVAGKGVERLKEAGVEVVEGVLRQKCLDLNKRFFLFHKQQRPYIVLKWAQTMDGFIDKIREEKDIGINWISSTNSGTLVHKWRSEEQAILVGKNTVLRDDPLLTVRKVTGNNPLRIVLDSNLQISTAKVFNTQGRILIFNIVKNDLEKNREWIQLRDMQPISIVKKLYELDVQSVLIEGGSEVLNSFINTGLWDEARVIVGKTLFGEGVKSPVLSAVPEFSFNYSTDTIHHYFHK